MNFDESLPAFVSIAIKHFGTSAFDSNIVLRDASGRLTFVMLTSNGYSVREAFDVEAHEMLGEYADIPSATPQELFDPSLSIIKEDDLIDEYVTIEDTFIRVRLLDRRIIGEDWNRPNFSQIIPSTPIVTFFSCKGGVGRSTALAVASAAFSDLGKRVLIVDFDLEAPGLGPIFLQSADMPKYGSLDYFVENGRGSISDDFLRNCIAPSPLTAGRGLIEVVPAVGRMGRNHPQNIIPKLGRAFLIDADGQGGSISFLDQTRTLLSSLARLQRYDVILVDARAGLSESAAASVLGLGGTVLLFGVDTPQTFESYEYLLAHLSKFTRRISEDDWRLRLRMIHAKAARGEQAWKKFRDQSQDLFANYLYEEAGPDTPFAFNFDLDDPDAPHYAWPIPYDADYAEFDPVARRELLTQAFFSTSFGLFVDRLMLMLFPQENIDDA